MNILSTTIFLALLLTFSVDHCHSFLSTTSTSKGRSDENSSSSRTRLFSTTTTTTTTSIPSVPAVINDLDTEEGRIQLESSTFAIPPNDLIALAKKSLIEYGIGLKDDGACLADDFVFRAQFVEVDKQGMLGALKSFDLEESFNLIQNYYGWMVDPMQTNRVWFLNRQEATQVKEFAGVVPPSDGTSPPTHLVLPPQMLHLDFNEDGKIIEFGFYTVDRNQGNTGGLGGAFGFFYGVGRPLPFPEGKPYKMSFQRRTLEFVANMARKFQTKKE